MSVSLPKTVLHLKFNDSQKAQFITSLKKIVGNKYVLTKDYHTRRYRVGFRFGEGNVMAVVRPKNLLEQWKILEKCVTANVIVIAQAANTGLTGGSTPNGDDYDRDIVIINTTRINHIYPINNGEQVVCLAGSTLHQLEQVLQPLNRDPHSVIGSSCIGASVIGGICNNSGGALIKRGPAYTELAVFAQVDSAGELKLVNHLGIKLGDSAEEILNKLDKGEWSENDIIYDEGVAASDHNYTTYVRDIKADTPARFNADPARLHEASGSAGKAIIFAVRLDTFAIEKNPQVFYLGTNDASALTEIRRHMLSKFSNLPIAGEYIHKDAFNIAEKYGKDTFLLINYLGTKRFPKLFDLKSRFDAFCDRLGFLPAHFSDRLMQFLSYFFPRHLPLKLRDYRDKYEHHLMLKVSQDMVEETSNYLKAFFVNREGSFFQCTKEEGEKAFLHRFAAAGAAVRYRNIHTKTVEDIVALDIALPRNELNWLEKLPPDIEKPIIHKIYYGHFFCYVFHQDYIIEKGHNCIKLEHKMWEILNQRRAEYPAEHNVGHLYFAKPALKEFYKHIDPCNCFNPGIGHTSKSINYQGNKEL